MFYTKDYPKEIDPLQFITEENESASKEQLLYEVITDKADLEENIVYIDTILKERDYDDHGKNHMIAIYRIKNKTKARTYDGDFISSSLYGISYSQAKWGDIDQWEDFPPILRKLTKKEVIATTYEYV